MLTYATLLSAYLDSLKAVGVEAYLNQTEDYIEIHLPGGFYSVLPQVCDKTLHLDPLVIKVITEDYLGDRSLLTKVSGSIQNGVGYLPTSLVEFDESFWHFNNGYSGLSQDQRSRFGNWCNKNHIRFSIKGTSGDYQNISGSRLCELRPDNALIHVIILQLSLATMDLLERFQADTIEVPNWIFKIGTLCDIFGVSLDVFRWALPTIKGLSKSCGEWAIDGNRTAMFRLCSMLDKVSCSTKSVYSVSPESVKWVNNWNLQSKLALASDYLRYLRQYASVVLVIQSLSYYIVFSDELTPETRCSSWLKVIEQFGRVTHDLFIRQKYLMEDNSEVELDAKDC